MIYLLVSLFFSQELGFGQMEKKKKSSILFPDFLLDPNQKEKEKTKEEREKHIGVFNSMHYKRQKAHMPFSEIRILFWGREGGSFCMKTPFLNCRFLLS